MLRVLQACEASPAIVEEFESTCRLRSTETAEELLYEICVRHGFMAPYARDGMRVVVRPCNLDQTHPDYHPDYSSDCPMAEQSYRRGYDQGAASVMQMLRAGKSISEIAEFLREIRDWRTQPVQSLRSLPGSTISQKLPDRWRFI